MLITMHINAEYFHVYILCRRRVHLVEPWSETMKEEHAEDVAFKSGPAGDY